MVNSKLKGKQGEREWVKWLREHLDAETVSRGQQDYVGGHVDPDVKGLVGWWCEVKRVERFSVWKVLDKLMADWGLRPMDFAEKPLVAFRRNRGKWWVILRAEDWAGLIKAVERAESELDRVSLEQGRQIALLQTEVEQLKWARDVLAEGHPMAGTGSSARASARAARREASDDPMDYAGHPKAGEPL